MEDLIVRPIYLWAFQTNRKYLNLLFPFCSEKQPIMSYSIYDVIMNTNQRSDLLMKSHLAVILSKKLVGNMRYPRKHIQMILSQQHNFQDIKCVNSLEDNFSRINSIAFHPRFPILAIGGKSKNNFGYAKLCCLSSDGLLSYYFPKLIDYSYVTNLLSVAFHPTLPILATGKNDKTAKIWQLSLDGSNPICISSIKEHSTVKVLSVVFHPISPILATVYSDEVVLWRLSQDGSVQQKNNCITILESNCSSVAFHPSAPIIAIGKNDYTIKLWRLSSDWSINTCIATLLGHIGQITAVAFHPTEPILATASKDKTAKLWRLSHDDSTANCIATLIGHTGSIRSVAFHPKASILATGSSDNTAKLWLISQDGTRATCLATLAHGGSVRSVAFHPTASILATGGKNEYAKLWK